MNTCRTAVILYPVRTKCSVCNESDRKILFGYTFIHNFTKSCISYHFMNIKVMYCSTCNTSYQYCTLNVLYRLGSTVILKSKFENIWCYCNYYVWKCILYMGLHLKSYVTPTLLRIHIIRIYILWWFSNIDTKPKQSAQIRYAPSLPNTSLIQ